MRIGKVSINMYLVDLASSPSVSEQIESQISYFKFSRGSALLASLKFLFFVRCNTLERETWMKRDSEVIASKEI